MYGQDILCGISKVPFEIPHKMSYHTLKDVYFICRWNFKSSEIQGLASIFETPPSTWIWFSKSPSSANMIHQSVQGSKVPTTWQLRAGNIANKESRF